MHPTGTRLGWWGWALLGAGAALQLVHSALVWASGSWGLDSAARVPVAVFIIVMAVAIIMSVLAVLVKRDLSIMMIALAG